MPALPESIRACLFDLDGVLTDTAAVHAVAWKQAFDDYLSANAGIGDDAYRPFDSDVDYREFVDGKRRADGVASFFASRGLAVPLPAQEVVAADKTARFDAMIRTNGLAVYPDVVDYLEFLRSRGIHRAVVSASEHCEALVEAAGITDMFEIRVDGQRATADRLRGKPAADTYLAAAADLGVAATNCAVFEDAIAGLNAGRAGGFGAVVGVNRKGLPTQPFFDAGATIVVTSFEELLPA